MSSLDGISTDEVFGCGCNAVWRKAYHERPAASPPNPPPPLNEFCTISHGAANPGFSGVFSCAGIGRLRLVASQNIRLLSRIMRRLVGGAFIACCRQRDYTLARLFAIGEPHGGSDGYCCIVMASSSARASAARRLSGEAWVRVIFIHLAARSKLRCVINRNA